MSYKLELLHHFIGGKKIIEARGLKSLFKSVTTYNFSKVVRDTQRYIDLIKKEEIPFYDEYSFIKMKLARQEVIKELEFYNSSFWISHKEVDFFSKNSSSLDDFLWDILNNTIFFDCIGYRQVRLNNLELHNQGIIVVGRGFTLLK